LFTQNGISKFCLKLSGIVERITQIAGFSKGISVTKNLKNGAEMERRHLDGKAFEKR